MAAPASTSDCRRFLHSSAHREYEWKSILRKTNRLSGRRDCGGRVTGHLPKTARFTDYGGDHLKEMRLPFYDLAK
jgi:hypothetical protein